MAHNIEVKDGKASIAFMGDRNDIWHRLGNQMKEGQSIEEWTNEAGLNWEAELQPTYTKVDDNFIRCGNEMHVVRMDTKYPLGHVSDHYKIVQPVEIMKWFEQYVSVDPRFKLDVAGCLKSGEIIWATATFNGDIKVAGDNHVARLLMTTTFDGTGSTINKATMTRVVCNNTLDAALAGGKGGTIKTRHNTKFDPEVVSKQLGNIVQSINAYKAMGDAMVEMEMSKDVVSKYFKRLLDIPFEAKEDDISTRKLNMFEDLNQAYKATVNEGTAVDTAWCALNAVTRYVDHSRTIRTGAGCADETRFLSSQMGSGATMKEKAVTLLTTDEAFASLLKQPFKPSEKGEFDTLMKAPLRG